jgi:hypothetical protein
MIIDMTYYFPAHTHVMALPNRNKPRLFIMNNGLLQRWQHSRLYPAFRPTAQIYRLALRLKAALGIGSSYRTAGDIWELAEFLQPVLPNVTAAVVLLGTPGPAQKITVQLWNGNQVIGYLKFADKPAAKAGLEREHTVLKALPQGVAPRVISYGAFNAGMALVTAPVAGKALPARLASAKAANSYLNHLQQKAEYSIDYHPWVKRMRTEHANVIDEWLAHLTDRKWRTVFQHGDFAPWNIFCSNHGRLLAIDWEYGNLEGFPMLDQAYFLLQVAALISRWSPQRVKAYAVRQLSKVMSHVQATSIVNLAAFEGYQQALADGHSSEQQLQQWRRAVWESQ